MLDVGANVGWFMASAALQGARVLAFEGGCAVELCLVCRPTECAAWQHGPCTLSRPPAAAAVLECGPLWVLLVCALHSQSAFPFFVNLCSMMQALIAVLRLDMPDALAAGTTATADSCAS